MRKIRTPSKYCTSTNIAFCPRIVADFGDQLLDLRPLFRRGHDHQLPAFVAVMRSVHRINPIALGFSFDRRAAKTLPKLGDNLRSLSAADPAAVIAPGWNERGDFHRRVASSTINGYFYDSTYAITVNAPLTFFPLLKARFSWPSRSKPADTRLPTPLPDQEQVNVLKSCPVRENDEQ